MTNAEIEVAAWRFWFDEISFFLAPGNHLTKARIDEAISALVAMDPMPFVFGSGLAPKEMKALHGRALPIYISIGDLIKSRVAE